jgi:hypothetical protein
MNKNATGARADLEESITVATAMGHEVLVAQALGHLAAIDLLDGRLDDGRDRVREQLERVRRLRNLEGLATALDTTAGLAVRRERWETAALTAAAADALRERIRLPSRPLSRGLHDTAQAAVQEHLGAQAAPLTAEAIDADPWSVADRALGDLESPPRDAPD